MQRPQSAGQLEQSSPALQVPSPHVTQRPQSVGHDAHVSPMPQVPSPQRTHEPQSPGQLKQVSPPLHIPSPHVSQRPQSIGQLEHVSVGWHVPSGHVGQSPQSPGHVVQSSPPEHIPSPQPPHEPQSAGQLEHDSVNPHTPLPHTSGGASGRAPSGSVPPSMSLGSTRRTDRPQPETARGIAAPISARRPAKTKLEEVRRSRIERRLDQAPLRFQRAFGAIRRASPLRRLTVRLASAQSEPSLGSRSPSSASLL